MKSIRNMVCLFYFGIGAFSLMSQEVAPLEPLITDRPDATESPYVLQKCFTQVETGPVYESFEQTSKKIK